MTSKQEEFKKLRIWAEDLVERLPPTKNEWSIEGRRLLIIQILIEQARAKGLMTWKEEREIRIAIAKREYQHILESPDIIENEEKKEKTRRLLLDDWLHLSGLDKCVSAIKSH